MYTLTEQDIKFLDGIAGRIETAIKHDYARNMQTSQVEYLKVLYKKMYGTEYVGSSSCSTCQLRLLKKVGEWFEKRKVDVELVLCESNSIGTPMTELLTQANPRMRIESATTTNTSKAQMVSALQVRLEKGTITLLDEPRQTAEISAYEAVYNPKTKNVTYNAPQGLHDDSVISLMLALKAFEQGNKKGKYYVR